MMVSSSHQQQLRSKFRTFSYMLNIARNYKANEANKEKITNLIWLSNKLLVVSSQRAVF